MNRRSFLKSACGAAAAWCSTGFAENSRSFTVQAGALLLEFCVEDDGFSLYRIHNRASGTEHLVAPSPLFEIADAHGLGFSSNRNITLEHFGLEADGALQAQGRARNLPVMFHLRIAPSNRDTATIYLRLQNMGSAPITLRIASPSVGNLNIAGQYRPMMGVVPQEIAGVVSLAGDMTKLGMPLNENIGLPNAMNTMELASIYDPDSGAGVFFMDAEADLDKSVAPTQFLLGERNVSGHRLERLNPGEDRTIPTTLVGAHLEGGWSAAIDEYLARHRENWSFPSIPNWLREQGAIYSFSGSGGGAIYMEYPYQDLEATIGSFHRLPMLLDEAKSLGTNIVYLWDYWEGTSEGGRPPYWNKGDYIPRKSMGGMLALREGIRRIHEQNGRVILYLEPFIIFEFSEIGRRKGLSWAGRDPQGNLYRQYPQNYSMVACFEPWQDYITNVAVRLVRELDADGIYLDSWGWQMNWSMKTAEEGVLYSPLDYNRGVLALAQKIRNAIREVKPDSVVIGETTSGALGRYWDGGLSADFAWLAPQNKNKILASPVRYGIPEMNVFSNGRNLAELNQVFAAGHGLALLNANLGDAEYIRKLVEIRQAYKHLLIYGKQKSISAGSSGDVVAYRYDAGAKTLMTAVNTSKSPTKARIASARKLESSGWHDLISQKQYSIGTDGILSFEIPAEGLSVLIESSDQN